MQSGCKLYATLPLEEKWTLATFHIYFIILLMAKGNVHVETQGRTKTF